MPMFVWFFLLIPLLELYLLIRVGSETGALSVLLWILFTGVAGILCIRMAGVATAFGVRERMARGEVPDDAMLTGLLWVIGGVLLFIPGFITDVVGLLCILPVTRYWLVRRMRHGMPPGGRQAGWQREEYRGQESGPQTEREPEIIEGEFERKEKE